MIERALVRWCPANAAGNHAHHYIMESARVGQCKGCGYARTWKLVEYDVHEATLPAPWDVPAS